MMEFSFSFRGTPATVSSGQSFCRPPEGGFADASAGEMGAIIAAIRAGTPWREEIERRFGAEKPWLRDIILSPKRQAFFDLVPEGARRILDVGSGWGQMALPLATDGRNVAALEPGKPRLEFIEAAATQDRIANHIAFVGADFLDCEFPPQFDVVLSIGVLEWIGAFRHGTPPQEGQRLFLERARQCLVPGGALVLGIENRLGAKYLLGCPDDHLGVPHIGCLPADQAAVHWKNRTGHDLRCFTYADFELREMLSAAGFSDLHFHGAFPDYKLTEVIIPLDQESETHESVITAGWNVIEHNGHDGSPLSDEFQARLQAFYRDAVRLGMARHFVPSFFVVAR